MLYCIMYFLGVSYMNIQLWKFRKEDEEYGKSLIVVYIFLLCVTMACLWSCIELCFFPGIATIVVSYINACRTCRHFFTNRWAGTLLFIVLSALFVTWLTVLFGEFYYLTGLLDSSTISECCNKIESIPHDMHWFVQLLMICKEYLIIGFKGYNVLAEGYQLCFPRLVQYFAGTILIASISSVIKDFFKALIAPKLPT